MKYHSFLLALVFGFAACKSSTPVETLSVGYSRVNIKTLTAFLIGAHFDSTQDAPDGSTLPITPGSTSFGVPENSGDSLVSSSDCYAASFGDTTVCCSQDGSYYILFDAINHVFSGTFGSSYNWVMDPYNTGSSWGNYFECSSMPYSGLNDTTWTCFDFTYSGFARSVV